MTKGFVERMDHLEQQLMRLRAKRVQARQDRGESMTFPAEAARRTFVCDGHSIRFFREWPCLATLQKLVAALDVPLQVLAE